MVNMYAKVMFYFRLKKKSPLFYLSVSIISVNFAVDETDFSGNIVDGGAEQCLGSREIVAVAAAAGRHQPSGAAVGGSLLEEVPAWQGEAC